jgi:hypothetical protein
MKEVYLKCDMLPYEKSSVNALIDRLYTIAKSNYGVLSASCIWFELFDRFLIDSEKEILTTFGLHDLKSKIYGISDIGLQQDVESMRVYLVFKIEEEVQKECSTDCVAKDISDIYAYINEIETKSQLKANIEVTTVRATVNFPKDDPVEHDIVNNIFDSVRAVYKGLNKIKEETGVKTGVVITGLGIHFDSVKDKLGFSISVEKKELDNAADMRMPIKNTIDIAIKKVTE